MPALKKTDLEARIVWLGCVGDRDAALASTPTDRLDLTFAGAEGEDHGGATRPSCSRLKHLYARGTEIRNTRQLSVLSEEELAQIAAKMDLDRLDPAWLGVTILLSGLPDFSHVPPGSRLQSASGCTITVDMENLPCQLPAKVIEEVHSNKGRKFKSAAAGKRGVTAWVERPGTLAVGDVLTLFIPDQPAWAGLDEIRAAGA